MGQPYLLCNAHLLESHGSVSFAVRGSYARHDSFSGLESLTLIALSCDPKLFPAGQQTAKHDGLYPLLSVSLTVPPFVERFQQRDDSCRVGFYALAFFSPSFFGFHKSYIYTTSFWLSNVASLAHVYVEILHHAQIGQNAYTEYARTMYIYINI